MGKQDILCVREREREREGDREREREREVQREGARTQARVNVESVKSGRNWKSSKKQGLSKTYFLGIFVFVFFFC